MEYGFAIDPTYRVRRGGGLNTQNYVYRYIDNHKTQNQVLTLCK